MTTPSRAAKEKCVQFLYLTQQSRVCKSTLTSPKRRHPFSVSAAFTGSHVSRPPSPLPLSRHLPSSSPLSPQSQHIGTTLTSPVLLPCSVLVAAPPVTMTITATLTSPARPPALPPPVSDFLLIFLHGLLSHVLVNKLDVCLPRRAALHVQGDRNPVGNHLQPCRPRNRQTAVSLTGTPRRRRPAPGPAR